VTGIDWRFLFDPHLVAALLSGLKVTAVLTLTSGACALAIGTVVALLRTGRSRALRAAARSYVGLLRNVPVIVQLFFWYFGLTVALPVQSFPFVRSPHFGSCVAVFTISIVMGAFISEVIRAGIEAVPIGQAEAALALGLRRRWVYRHVVIPQLLPIVLPGLGNEFVNVLKSTAFAMTIGVTDLMWQAQEMESQTFRGVETMTAVTVLYFVMSSVIIGSYRLLERLLAPPAQHARHSR